MISYFAIFAAFVGAEQAKHSNVQAPLDTVKESINDIKESVDAVKESVDTVEPAADPVEAPADPVKEPADDDDEVVFTMPNGETMTREEAYGEAGTFRKFSLTTSFLLDPKRWHVILMFDRDSQDEDADDVTPSMTQLAKQNPMAQIFWVDMENAVIRQTIVPASPCKKFPCVSVQNVKSGNFTLSFAREFGSGEGCLAGSVAQFLREVSRGKVRPFRTRQAGDNEIDNFIRNVREVITAQDALATHDNEQADKFEYAARQLMKKNTDDEKDNKKLTEMRTEASRARKSAKKEQKMHGELVETLDAWLALRALKQELTNKVILGVIPDKNGKKENATELMEQIEDIDNKAVGAMNKVIDVYKKCLRGQALVEENIRAESEALDEVMGKKSSKKNKNKVAHGDDVAADVEKKASFETHDDAALKETKTDSRADATDDNIVSEKPKVEAENLAESKTKDEL